MNRVFNTSALLSGKFWPKCRIGKRMMRPYAHKKYNNYEHCARFGLFHKKTVRSDAKNLHMQSAQCAETILSIYYISIFVFMLRVDNVKASIADRMRFEKWFLVLFEIFPL
jgi:hypothetical protein